MTLKKSLLIASLGAAVALAGLSTKASAADPVLGALIGGGIGAAIGHNTHHRDGAAVGGVLGAIIGSGIAADSNRYYDDRAYYDDRYYGGGYYAPSYGYYTPARPYYYAPAPRATIVYSSGPTYRHRPYRDYRWRDDRRYDRHWR